MQKYDVALKTLLQASGVSILHQLAGAHLARWINTELPEMKAPRLDLLGETETGELVHFELQSVNDLDMPLRMAEYAVAVRRHFGRFPVSLCCMWGRLNCACKASAGVTTIGVTLRIERSGRLRPAASTADADSN